MSKPLITPFFFIRISQISRGWSFFIVKRMKYQHFHFRLSPFFFIFLFFDFSVLRFFSFVLLFRFYVFFDIFQQWWNSSGFISFLACRLFFWSQKDAVSDAMRMCIWNKDGWGLGTCGCFQNVFLAILFFSQLFKKHKFLLSQIDYWMSPFWRLFFNDFHENSKKPLRGAPKRLKKPQVL